VFLVGPASISHVDDDLTTLVREAERIRTERLLTLRLLKLDGPKE